MLFTQSPFLQALGHAITNSLWQFALLYLLYILMAALVRSSHARFAVGSAFQLTGFVWFVVTFIIYYQQYLQPGGGSSLSPLSHDTGINHTGLRERIFAILLQAEQFLPYLSIAYLVLLLFLFVKWLQAYRYTNTIRNTGISKIDVEWRLFINKLSAQLGIKRPVRIFVSSIVNSPLTIGFFKPVILVPIACINHLTTAQLEAVLLHELAHIRRHDYLLNIFLSVVEIFLFFNPFMQLISKQVKKERENSCDDWVLQYQYSASTYARALLSLATAQQNSPSLALNATDRDRILLNRVKRMVEKKSQEFTYRQQVLSLVIITVIAGTLAWLSPAQRKQPLTRMPATNAVVEPAAIRVNNPLFNPVILFVKKETLQSELAATKLLSTNNPVAGNAIDNSKKPSDLPLQAVQEKQEVADGTNFVLLTNNQPTFDTSFRNDLRMLINASVWNDMEQVEKELKILQQIAGIEHPMVSLPAFEIENVEAGMNMLRKLKADLLFKAANTKTEKEKELLNMQVKEFAAIAISMKKLVEEWQKETSAINKRLFAFRSQENILKINEMAVIATSVTDANPLILPAEPLQSNHAGLDNMYIDSARQEIKAPEGSTPVVAPTPPIRIYINQKGKVIKLVKI